MSNNAMKERWKQKHKETVGWSKVATVQQRQAEIVTESPGRKSGMTARLHKSKGIQKQPQTLTFLRPFHVHPEQRCIKKHKSYNFICPYMPVLVKFLAITMQYFLSSTPIFATLPNSSIPLCYAMHERRNRLPNLISVLEIIATADHFLHCWPK